jgi:uncharacterized protein (DUF1501 family)
MNPSKRQFLRAGAGLSMSASALTARLGSPFAASLAGLAGLAAQSAAAATVGGDYRALVCLFMAGGNDSHNWVVPVDASGFAEYSRVRSSLALPMSSLTALSGASRQAAGRQFGMPAELAPLRELYESKQLAVVSNVGPLVRPTTKAEYLAGASLPPKLYSHNDQSSNWQALAPEGARAGWGGRIADALMGNNGSPVFTTVSASGNAVFLSGSSAIQYQINTAGAVGVGGFYDRYTLGSSTVGSVLRKTEYDAGDNPFQSEVARVVKRSAEAYDVLSKALATVNVAPIVNSAARLPNGASLALDQTPLAKQLRAVAQMIAAGPTLGMRRQVFMVSMGGFDTHGNEMRDQPLLMATVAQSISYFMNTMRGLGLSNNVTLFTASEFGRTLTSNGSGSDHGWGGHHFVAGGAVRGGDIYGRFPITALGTADDLGSGRMLPSTSVTEYAATMARWMGLSASDLAVALPGLSNFGAADLAFV